jgi:hypothetical protein
MAVVVRYFRTFSLALLTFGMLVTAGGAPRATEAQVPCSILVLDMDNAWDTESLDAIGGYTYTLVSPAAFATTDLSQFDVLFAPSAFQDGAITIPAQNGLNALNQRAADIASFVSAGGGLVALAQPIGTGRFSWSPVSATPSVHTNNELITVAAPAHPVNTGITSAQLSFWLEASHHSFASADPEFDVLALEAVSGAKVSLAIPQGAGRVFLTGQDPDYHIIESDGTSAPDAGAALLLSNALDWACGISEPEDSDGDGCSDTQEAGPLPSMGGDRDPLDFWDFFDVTGPGGIRDKAIDLQDTLAILEKFGRQPGQPGYDPALDRMVSDALKPWRTAQASGAAVGIDLQDALINLQSFGHNCNVVG